MFTSGSYYPSCVKAIYKEQNNIDNAGIYIYEKDDKRINIDNINDLFCNVHI